MRGMCMFVQPLNALTAGASGRPSPSDTSHHPAHGSASKSGAQSPASSPPHQMHWPYHYASWCHPRVAPQHSPSSLTPGVAVGIAIFHVDTSDDDPANPARCIAFGHFDLASWNPHTKHPRVLWCPLRCNLRARPAGNWVSTPGPNQFPLARRQHVSPVMD